MFPQTDMRGGASTAVQQLARALPILEAFMEQPFPHPDVRLWYGFIWGALDGGAEINVDDESNYLAGPPPPTLPMEAILVHELSHNYIGHEGLNQFLEMYQYNVVETGSTDPALWTYARTLGPPGDPSISSAALVDVYRLIGHDAMSSAYHAVYALNPPYGQPLSSAVKQVFIDQAPESLRAQVTALMARVVY